MSRDRRVLILDDDAMVGMLIETVVRLDGADVRLTAEVPAFLAELDTWLPTHLVVDLTLPGVSGEAVLQMVADLGCAARVVIASGSEPERLDDAAAAARAAGLDVAGVIVKPFAPAVLRGLLA